MRNSFLWFTFFLSLLTTLTVFIFSCVAALSDAQGAILFVFSAPLMFVLLFGTHLFMGVFLKKDYLQSGWKYVPYAFIVLLTLFLVTPFVPGLNSFSTAVLSSVGKSFELATGKSPYVYFRERSSFPFLLQKELSKATTSSSHEVDFDKLEVTFAWDQLCILGPYTDLNTLEDFQVTKFELNKKSHIQSSDSINALIFYFQGKVNHVIDLERRVADFQKKGICLSRNQTKFSYEGRSGILSGIE